MTEGNERPVNGAHPSSSVGLATNISAPFDLRSGSTTSPTTPHSPSVICDVQDLYYAIELPAGGSSGRGISSNGWRPRATKICRHLRSVRRKGNTGAHGPGDVTAGDSAAGWGDTAMDTTSRELVLLRGISCRVLAGDMVAVIGASGAGKSTFLDLLAGRKFDGKCAGQIILASDGIPRGSSSAEGEVVGRRGRASVYVTQENHHVAELTVRESLAFAARLSMGGPGITDRDRHARVEGLLSVLGLESCADVRVGNPLERGISGGQARRLSVGVGVADLESVRLLLLDEPTTGLDSSSATEVLQLARRLANRADRRAVVASVHQPSAEMFALFDKVLVLVGGRQAFFGPVGEASKILSRPEKGIISFPGQNPAEFILVAAKAAIASRLLSGDHPQDDSREMIFQREDNVGTVLISERNEGHEEKGSGANSEMSEAEQLIPILAGGAAALAALAGVKGSLSQILRRSWMGEGGAAYAVGFWAQFSTVWRRGWMVELRRTEALWAFVAKNMFVGFLTAVVFWQKGDVATDKPLINPLLHDVTPDASNIMGLLYFGTLYGLTGHLEAIPDMFKWKMQFERERAAGMYSTTVYWLASSTVHMPVIFAGFVLYLNTCYWALGLPAVASKYFVFGGVVLASTLMGYSLAQALSAAVGSPQIAFATWPLLLVTSTNFTGFTVRLPVVRIWYRWMSKVSFCRWPYQLIVTNEFRDFDEGPELLDLYFGKNRTSMLAIAGIMLLFYVSILLLSLLFLQPRRSRLRILRETPASLAAAASIQSPDAAGDGGRGEQLYKEGEAEGWRKARRHERDSDLLEIEEGGEYGPLYYLEEGEKDPDQAPNGGALEKEGGDSLRAPLLGSGPGPGLCKGSTVTFRDVHYFIYLRGGTVEGEKSATAPAKVEYEIGPSGDRGSNSSNSNSSSSSSGGGGSGSGGSSSKEAKNEAHVLRGVTGVVSPGKMMAILGPSGSGKTTLLDLLGGRKTPSVGRREGDIIVDGVMAREEGTGGRGLAGSAYVMQDNVHHTALTVMQTLNFAAKLRMSRTASAQQRKERVRYLVSMLGLEGVLETKVGDESKRGISGGEAKRLSIAVEAINLPGLLLLDEPTSGLDATTALEVMVAVRSLSDKGRTVVASLHQPSVEMFVLFDTCLLLTRGGHQAYFGEANRAMEYFTSIGLVPPPAANDINPADFLISVASIGAPPSPGGVNGPSPFEIAIAVPKANTDGGDGDGIEGVDVDDASDEDIEMNLGVGIVGEDVSASTLSTRPVFPMDESGVLIYPSVGRGRGRHPPGSVEELQSAFAESEQGLRMAEEAFEEAERASRADDGAGSQGRRWLDKRSMFWLSMVLTHRELTATWQDRRAILVAIVRHVFVGIFYGTLWWRLGVGKVSERVGLIFFSLVFVMLGNQQNMPKIFFERLLFYREKGAGVYGSVEYWLSIGFAPIESNLQKNNWMWSVVVVVEQGYTPWLAPWLNRSFLHPFDRTILYNNNFKTPSLEKMKVPLMVLNIFVYAILVYFLAGLHDDSWKPFGYFVLAIMLCNLNALAFCQMLAAATRTQDIAVSLFPAFLFFFIAFAGFIVRLPTLPDYLSSWAPKISFVRWAMEGLVINEFRGNEEAIFSVPVGVPITPKDVYGNFLEAYGFGDVDEGREIVEKVLWILVVNLLVFRLLCLLCLKFVTFERR